MTEKNFFTKLPYLMFISLVTLAIWYYGQEQLGYFIVQDWGVLLFSFIAFILFLSLKNTIYIIPYILNVLFMISQTDWDLTVIPISLYLAIAMIILGTLAHVLIYRVNIFRGKFLIGLVGLAIAVIVSTLVNTETYSLFTLLIFMVTIFYVFLYGFFTNTMKGDHLEYLLKIFAILGLLISLQVAIFYIRSGDITHALETKTLDLGWGISNFIATYLIMFISTTFYFVKKYKLHIIWILITLFEIAMLLFTLSRAGIIAFAGTTVLLLIFMFVKYEHKGALLLNLLIGIVLVSLIAYYFRDYFITIWERLDLYGLDDNGRIEIWQEAWSKFLANPFFGDGILARETAVGVNELRMFHNTILEVLACFGALGGLALLIQAISVIRIFLVKLTQPKAILVIALIGVNAHGMVDNIYLMPQYMVLLFIILAFVENANVIDRLRMDLEIR